MRAIAAVVGMWTAMATPDGGGPPAAAPSQAPTPAPAPSSPAAAPPAATQTPLERGMELLHKADNTAANLQGAVTALSQAAGDGTLNATTRARAQAHLGLAYLRLGDLEQDAARKVKLYEQGKEAAIKATFLDPDLADAWFYRGATVGRWAQQKGMVKALTHLDEIRGAFEKALLKDPHHHSTLLAMGIMEKQIPTLMGGSTRRAEARFRQVLKEDPHHTRAMMDLAEFLFEEDRKDEAKSWAEKARDEKAPSNAAEWRKFDRPRAVAWLKEHP